MISFVIPLMNEEENLRALHEELSSAIHAARLESTEIIFIDDGSTDGSWNVVEEIAQDDPRVTGIKFRRNFGKAAALTAGFAQASGNVIFTLDGDLQDDPVEIPRFLAKLDDGFDLVSGWKKRRHDPWHKVGPSRVFNWLVSNVTHCHLHDHNCGYKAYRRAVIDEVTIHGELHRFVPALAHARGFRVGELEVHHRARTHGVSKYGFSRFLKGLFDLFQVRFVTRYGQRPLHVLGTIGLGFFGLGMLGLIVLMVGAAFGWSVALTVVPAIASGALAITGTLLIALGFVAELLTSYNLDVSKTYTIAAKVGSQTAAQEFVRP